jgi:hypothetical protein
VTLLLVQPAAVPKVYRGLSHAPLWLALLSLQRGFISHGFNEFQARRETWLVRKRRSANSASLIAVDAGTYRPELTGLLQANRWRWLLTARI